MQLSRMRMLGMDRYRSYFSGSRLEPRSLTSWLLAEVSCKDDDAVLSISDKVGEW